MIRSNKAVGKVLTHDTKETQVSSQAAGKRPTAVFGRLFQRPMNTSGMTVSDALYKGGLFIWAVVPLLVTFSALGTAVTVGGIGPIPLLLFLGRWFFTGMGITAGFHRLLTHRAYEARPFVKLAILICGSMAGQGRCIDWACFHIDHHLHADKPDDPHSPHRSEGEGWLDAWGDFFHSHMGWFFTGKPANREKHGKAMMADPVISFVDRTFYLWLLLGFIIPYLIGGLDGLIWGGFVGFAFVNHATFAVNSVCHTFGSRSFDTDDQSRNNTFVGLITWGEGIHNDHHFYPGAAVYAMPGQFDPTGKVILGLAKLGWVKVDPSRILTPERAQKILELQARARNAKAQTAAALA